MSGPTLRRHRITSAEYHRMAAAGILPPDARVELIEGEIIDMAPIGSRHAAAVERLAAALRRAVSDRALVRTQQPVALDEHSEPEPDLAVVIARDDYYESGHPQPSDVFLIVEVSDTTLAYDRDVKAPLYARHGVQEVWIVDVENRVIERHSAQSGGEFTGFSISSTSGELVLSMLGGVGVDFSLT